MTARESLAGPRPTPEGGMYFIGPRRYRPEVVPRKILWEQRYRAVMEVRGGQTPDEVAARHGVTRQTVIKWLGRYNSDGPDGLRDQSRRPHRSPTRIASDIEATICELRRTHRRWSARRIREELDHRGVVPVPSQITVHRILVRNGLIRHRRRDLANSLRR
ncbi:helix-turn-helix domain-containing protein [Nocardia wallacei]|uniref:helix-turn-helix domain-containing protein n=1 Tax=Nocardia wallacei TaxID=480035 RepID=UPI00245527FC|nr:helix-turn-helix domain-containing protein [Nocardia wallacei]